MLLPMDTLNGLLNQIANCSPEDKKKLESVGYDLNAFQAELARFVQIQERTKHWRHGKTLMDEQAQQAVAELAYALKIDSGPDYRKSCQSAFMHLLGLENFDYQDAELAFKIFRPDAN